MSRHKVVQNLDEDDLYDEDDYGEDYDQGLNPEEEEQFIDAIAAVKQVSSQFPDITEKEIKDAVWDSYFNVDDAVNVLLDEQAKKEAKKKKQATKKPKTTQVSKQQNQEIRKGFQGPSPDETVKRAQSKAKGFDPKLEKTRAEMEKVKIGPPATTAPKVKLIDVVSEYKKQQSKPSISFVVIGHVDAGKSTLMGRLLYDVGAVDRRTIEKYRRESEKMGKSSFALAWVLDETEEERTRGVTVDFATSYFETQAARFTVLDAPGHRDFVPNMIAGAAQADTAILVVDSSTDAFESGFNLDGQTKEHAVLVRSLGVQNIIVAVNKLDNCDWSQDRFDEISQQLSGFLTSAGFGQDKVTFVPCSGLHGDYVVKPGNLEWYHGKTLLECLEHVKPTARDIQGPVRMPISDVFKNNQSGAVMVSGRLVSGTLQVGQPVSVIPSDEATTFTIRSVLAREEPRQWAVAGSNITLDIGTGADVNLLKPGDVVCSPDKPIPVTNKFKARILTFNLQRPIIVGASIELHLGRANRAAKISGIDCLIEAGRPVTNKSKRPPRHIGSGKGAVVEIEVLGHAIPLETYSKDKDLGRVVLRASGSTIAAGIVESLTKPTTPKSD